MPHVVAALVALLGLAYIATHALTTAPAQTVLGN